MYQEMYFALFRAITNALEEIERRNYGRAEELLRRARLIRLQFQMPAVVVVIDHQTGLTTVYADILRCDKACLI